MAIKNVEKKKKKKKLLKSKHLSTDNLSKVPQISPTNETIIRMGGGPFIKTCISKEALSREILNNQ